MSTFGGPNLAEKYKDYLRRVLTDGGFYARPDARDFQNDVDTILPLNPILYTPSNAGKVSKMYSVIPEDGTGDFTVSRNGTATYFDKDGLLKTAAADEPRFEFDPLTGEFKGVLVEPNRTNLLQRSEEFENTYWGKLNVTIVSNTSDTLAPDGTQTADKFYPNSTGSSRRIQRNTSSVLANQSASIFAKWDGGTIERIAIRGDSNSRVEVIFNVRTGVIERLNSLTTDFQSATIIQLPNGWFRCQWTYNSTIVNRTQVEIYLIDQDSNFTVTTNGTDGIFIWGAQLENNLTSSSYIPTVASTVTRPADVIDVTVPSGVTEIKETVNGVENTITSIPTTYQLPNGQISKVIMT
jgi:hypothetical protein